MIGRSFFLAERKHFLELIEERDRGTFGEVGRAELLVREKFPQAAERTPAFESGLSTAAIRTRSRKGGASLCDERRGARRKVEHEMDGPEFFETELWQVVD